MQFTLRGMFAVIGLGIVVAAIWSAAIDRRKIRDLEQRLETLTTQTVDFVDVFDTSQRMQAARIALLERQIAGWNAAFYHGYPQTIRLQGHKPQLGVWSDAEN